jgi:hypothetical protein
MKTSAKTIKRNSLCVFAIAAIFVCFGSSAFADIAVDFEGALPANVSFQAYNDSGSSPATSAGLSSDFAHSGTHSAMLYLGDPLDEARVKITGVGGTVATTSASYWAYEPVGTTTNTPFLMLYVDTNNNGISDGINSSTGDSYIITAPTNPLIPGQWVQETLTADTLVHVVGNRGTFGVESVNGSKYSAWNGFGRFGDLLNEAYGSSAWGNMNVFNAYVDSNYAGNAGTHTVYVDDINIATVPEPGTLTLLGIGGLTALGAMWIRRRRTVTE